MTAFEGKFILLLNLVMVKRFLRNRMRLMHFVLLLFFYQIEFGVLPEIAKAVDEMEWT